MLNTEMKSKTVATFGIKMEPIISIRKSKQATPL